MIPVARGKRNKPRRRDPRGRRSHSAPSRLPPLARFGLRLLRVTALAALPFALLVRGSVATSRYLHAPGWLAVGLGGILCAICLSLWGAWLWHRLTGRRRSRAIALRLALPLVFAFSVYTLGWLSHANAKSPAVRERWSDLHPSLRIAIGTAGLADRDFVVTEIGREGSDYDRMGLRRVRNSLHYTQPDGWIHAVDLRTRGHSELRNFFLRLYYEAMGFDTLRHKGTADHLHVSLPRSWSVPSLNLPSRFVDE